MEDANEFGTYFNAKEYDRRLLNLHLPFINPTLANAHNGLGVAYARSKEWPKAIDLKSPLFKTIKFDPWNLAYAYLQVEDKPHALPLLPI